MTKPTWMPSFRWYEIAMIVAILGLLIAILIPPPVNQDHVEAQIRKRETREKQRAVSPKTSEAVAPP